MSDDPYSTPTSFDSAPDIVTSEARWDDKFIRVVNVVRTWTTRRIVLEGSWNGDILYETVGFGERIRLNGTVVSTKWKGTGLTLNGVSPRGDFVLTGPDFGAAAAIEVYVSIFRLLTVTRFQLSVESQIIYCEGH